MTTHDSPTASWYDETFRDSVRFGLRVREPIVSTESAYQRIDIFDSYAFGRVLVLDGVFQTAEAEEHCYHEMLVHPALVTAPRIDRVLIIGGGDGGTAREVLRHDGVRRCVMVEIDQIVVDLCKRYLPSLGAGAWDDPRLDVRIGDGVKFVAETDDQFDVVLLDGSDPVGPSEGLFGESFYRDVARILAPDGVFALQSESPTFVADVFYDIQRALRRAFPRVAPYFGAAPLYATAPWTWTFASRAVDPLAIDDARAAAIESATRYYNRAVHRGAFAVPNEVARALADL